MINSFHLKVQNPVFPIQLMSLFTSGMTKVGCPNEPSLITKKKTCTTPKNNNWSVTHMYYTYTDLSCNDHVMIMTSFSFSLLLSLQSKFKKACIPMDFLLLRNIVYVMQYDVIMTSYE